jgi:hypothetical protein
MDQAQALLTETILQIGGRLADTLKNLKPVKDDHDFTSRVKVKVQQLKESHRTEIVGHIQLVISTATLRV